MPDPLLNGASGKSQTSLSLGSVISQLSTPCITYFKDLLGHYMRLKKKKKKAQSLGQGRYSTDLSSPFPVLQPRHTSSLVWSAAEEITEGALP